MGTQLPSPKKMTERSLPNFRPIFIVANRNGWMHQDATWYGGRPQPRRLCVRLGPSFPSLKGVQSPNFWPMFVVAKRLDGLRLHLVWRLASDQATPCSMGTHAATPSRTECTPTTLFSAHVYCVQTAGWINTPLGTEVDLGPGDVLDGVPALCETGTAAPHLFGPCLLWPRSPNSATAELLLGSRYYFVK